MRTIRGRLTFSFALALAATLLVFAVTIAVVESRQEQADANEQVALDQRLIRQVDTVTQVIAEAFLEGPVVVTVDQRQAFLPEAQLAFIDDYVIVYDDRGVALFTSDSTRALVARAGAFEQLASLGRNSTRDVIASAELVGDVGRVRYLVRRIDDAGPQVGRILYAVPNPEGLSPFAFATLTTAPIVLLAASFVGFLIAGTTLDPMKSIIDEIEAITDGRSLHRRVAEIDSAEELERLSTTVNNMLVRLERSFLSLRRFTADASHELKTPLTVLRAGVERAITHPEATPEVLAVLEETLIEVNRMTELVDSLLTLARADEGRAPMHLETVDVGELLGEVAETGSILGEQAKVDVVVDVPNGAMSAELDRSRTRQLFMNLLTNAIKYTPAGGRVTVTCRQVDDQLVLAVEDTGIGMSTSELDHAFDRFWRADVARSRDGDRAGVGLGLAISKWIAEAHGGTIDVSSRRGKGSTFTITLPIGTAQAA